MKKITTLLLVLFTVVSTLFGQTDPCSTIKNEISYTLNGTKVTLAVKSTGSVISQEWIFGDNTNNSKDATPTHDYGRAGTFTPCVYIIFKNPNSSTPCTTKVCKEITIQGSDPCANFSPTADITVDANGLATYKSVTGTGYSYSWSFGDGTSSNTGDGTHQYKPGTYKPCVTIYLVINGVKCSKTLCKEITVKDTEDPCRDFNPSMGMTVGADGVVTFEASAGTNYTYSWNFGDGTSSSDRVGKHTYKAGSYKPCVTITAVIGNAKCTKTICKEITVGGTEDPCKDFNPTFSYKLDEKGNAYFSGSNSTNTYTYTWSYGDGTSGTGAQTTHAYKPGTYKVCVTIYDTKTGCKKTVCQEITIPGTNTDPCKDFNPTFSYKIDGNVVVFEAQSGTNYTYKWIFSNSNQTSTERVVKIDFQKPGTYTACVYITDPKTKCTKKICKEIVIKAKETEDPCKNFNPKVSFQADGLKMHLEVDGGKGSTMEWSFGDGTKGSTDRKVTHVYTKAGKYTICVTVYDAKRKCKKTICFTIQVEGKTEDPCKNFNPDFSFKVTENKVVVVGSGATEYFWNWGDKTEGKGSTSDHSYKVAGKYTICVTAYDPKTGCKKVICKTISVGGSGKFVKPENDGKDAIMVYPNPAVSMISVITLTDSPAKIFVKDIYGSEVIRYDATPNENNSIDMLINDLPKGTYYVLVEQDGRIETTKFVK
ncbi:MAG: PKD domain-containing protein [Bacteroidia bacterium]